MLRSDLAKLVLCLLTTSFIVSCIGCAGINSDRPAAPTVQPGGGNPTPSPTPSPTPTTGGTFVYVTTQPSAGSTATGAIMGFQLHADGSLSPVPGSPFSFVSAASLGQAGSHLLAGGQTELDLLKVDPASGGLTLAATAPIPAGSIAGNDKYAYVGTGNGLYGYSLANDQLQLLPGFPMDTSATDTGRTSFVTLVVRQSFLFMALGFFHGQGAVDVNGIQPDGSLKPVNRSFPTPSVCDGMSTSGTITVHPSGRFIYENSSGDGLIIASFDPATATLGCARHTQKPINLPVFDPAGKFSYTGGSIITGPSQGTPAIHVYRVDQSTGDLAEIAGSPFPTGSSNGAVGPFAVDPSGKYLLTIEVFSDGSTQLGVYSIDPLTAAPVLIQRHPLITGTESFVSADLLGTF